MNTATNTPDAITKTAQKVIDLKVRRDALIRQLKAEEQRLLELMDSADKTRLQCSVGTITVCKGKRTVVVNDPALKAEIKLMQERGVRTGRASERIGNRYCLIRI